MVSTWASEVMWELRRGDEGGKRQWRARCGGDAGEILGDRTNGNVEREHKGRWREMAGDGGKMRGLRAQGDGG